MKKFGFGKSKDKDSGGRSGNSSPAPGSNPYAVNQPSNDAYSNPPPYSGGGGGNDRLRDNKSAGNASDYGNGGAGGGRYGAGGGSYGQAGGYGQQSRYGPSGGDDQPPSRYGAGGYGGLGAAPSSGADAGNRYGGLPSGGPGGNRFGGGSSGPAPQSSASRYGGGNDAPTSSSRYGNDAPAGGSRYGNDAPAGGSRYGNDAGATGNRYGGAAAGGYGASSGGYGGASGGYGDPPSGGNRYGGGAQAFSAEQDEQQKSQWDSGRGTGQGVEYGAYQDRQLTAEEQEEEDVQALKDEIRNIKQQDVSSTRNALRIAQMAEETGRGTLERLQQQGERIHNTERNLDLASNQNRLAAEKAREIKTLNRSMFAVHVKNPFTSNQRVAEREARVLEDAQNDRARRDATRAAAWSSNDRAQRLQMDMNKVGGGGGKPKGSLADRAKYQFEADSEDEEMENEIDGNIDLLTGAAGRMKIIANAMGSEIESQNKHIDRIGGKVDKVDDEIALNRSRLDRIK